jgi:hypothetical protein
MEKDMEKECYLYECDRYPNCERAKGMCCTIDFDSEKPKVAEGECTEENGWPLFVEKKHRFYKPEV